MCLYIEIFHRTTWTRELRSMRYWWHSRKILLMAAWLISTNFDPKKWLVKGQWHVFLFISVKYDVGEYPKQRTAILLFSVQGMKVTADFKCDNSKQFRIFHYLIMMMLVMIIQFFITFSVPTRRLQQQITESAQRNK